MQKNLAVTVVGDFKFLLKYFNKFYKNLISEGSYKGDIVVLTHYLVPTFLISNILKNKNVYVMRFKKVRFSRLTNNKLKNLNTKGKPNRHLTKNFQWHKLHVFNKKLKMWKYIFYIDLNMHIHHDINPILENTPNGKIYARSDGYPEFKKSLKTQFDETKGEFLKLKEIFDIEKKDYMQTGILFFDTNLIDENLFKDCIKLVDEFPISLTNEQGILNLYFMNKNIVVEELPLMYGDYLSYYYWKKRDQKIIITKQNLEKYK